MNENETLPNQVDYPLDFKQAIATPMPMREDQAIAILKKPFIDFT